MGWLPTGGCDVGAGRQYPRRVHRDLYEAETEAQEALEAEAEAEDDEDDMEDE